MDVSFLGITLVNISTLVLLSVIVLHNTTITKAQRFYFFLTAFVIAFICIMEFLTLIFDGAPLKYKWIHFLSNFLGFGLSPIVGWLLGNAIIVEKKTKAFFYLWLIYIGWMIISSIYGNGIFYIDEYNNYSRDSGFIVYIILYLASIAIFFIKNIMLSFRMQNQDVSILWLNFVFLTVGIFVQVFWPQIHITWLCISVSTLVYYIYHNELFQQVDILTGLFNEKNFIYNMSCVKKESTLVVIEIENFSKLRRNYNRNETNQMIKTIATEVRKYYSQYGKCFRINTEEFCVIINSTKLDIDTINKNFFITYVNNNYNQKNIALFNIGYTHFTKQDKLAEILSQTENSKRDFVQERLKYLYNNENDPIL